MGKEEVEVEVEVVEEKEEGADNDDDETEWNRETCWVVLVATEDGRMTKEAGVDEDEGEEEEDASSGREAAMRVQLGRAPAAMIAWMVRGDDDLRDSVVDVVDRNEERVFHLPMATALVFVLTAARCILYPVSNSSINMMMMITDTQTT